MIKYKYTSTALKIMQDSPELSFKPARADNGSSGYDLHCCLSESLTIWPDEVVKLSTGCHIWLGDFSGYTIYRGFKFAGLYLPRSSSPGLKLENTVGLLDSSYQGESFLKYKNTSNYPITINPGDKIGQLVIIPTYIGDMELDQNEWESTERGEGGFGSSGK